MPPCMLAPPNRLGTAGRILVLSGKRVWITELTPRDEWRPGSRAATSLHWGVSFTGR